MSGVDLSGKPQKIEGCRVKLHTGDDILATAFKTDRVNDRGYTVYVLAYANGAPLTVAKQEVKGFYMPVVPPRSTVTLAIED